MRVASRPNASVPTYSHILVLLFFPPGFLSAACAATVMMTSRCAKPQLRCFLVLCAAAPAVRVLLVLAGLFLIELPSESGSE